MIARRALLQRGGLAALGGLLASLPGGSRRLLARESRPPTRVVVRIEGADGSCVEYAVNQFEQFIFEREIIDDGHGGKSAGRMSWRLAAKGDGVPIRTFKAAA